MGGSRPGICLGRYIAQPTVVCQHRLQKYAGGELVADTVWAVSQITPRKLVKCTDHDDDSSDDSQW